MDILEWAVNTTARGSFHQPQLCQYLDILGHSLDITPHTTSRLSQAQFSGADQHLQQRL